MRSLALTLALCLLSLHAAAQNTEENAAEDNAESSPSPASAEHPEQARAQALHAEGAEELLEARFARARDLFRASFEIVPDGSTAYNLALALRGTGESLEAIAIFERILAGEFGAIGDETAREIRGWVRDERGALSTVHVDVDGPPEASVRVDGREVGQVRAGEPLTLQMDAGRRTILVDASGYQTGEEVIFAARAADENLRVMLLPEEEDARVFEKPAFWVVVGLVAAAGIAAGVVIALGPYERDPTPSETFGVAMALRSPL